MIAVNQLDEVVNMIEHRGLSEEVLGELRDRFPNTHFTWCMEDDIHTGKPVITRDAFAVYLVDSREHCSLLTTDLDTASGLVLAEIIPD